MDWLQVVIAIISVGVGWLLADVVLKIRMVKTRYLTSGIGSLILLAAAIFVWRAFGLPVFFFGAILLGLQAYSSLAQWVRLAAQDTESKTIRGLERLRAAIANEPPSFEDPSAV
jgi:hypothetical protein